MNFGLDFEIRFHWTPRCGAPPLARGEPKRMKTLLRLAFLFCTVSLHGQIVIGKLTFIGTLNGVSSFTVNFDADKTATLPFTLDNLVMDVNWKKVGTKPSLGPISVPGAVLFQGSSLQRRYSLPGCPCDVVTVQLRFANKKPAWVTLADGTKVEVDGISTAALVPGPGHQYIHTQQWVPIVLTVKSPE
jgi:hypothetical protein